jgi:hypothetical protein
MHRTNIDARHRNFAGLQEIQKGFERSKCRCLDTNTSTGLVDAVKERSEVGHDLLPQIILVVIRSDNK